MNKNMLSILLLLSVAGASVALEASNTAEISEAFPKVYAFSDLIAINKKDLELLVYPALTQIVHKRRMLALRRCNDHSCLAQTPEQKDAVHRYWEQENTYTTQVGKVYDTVKIFETAVTATNPQTDPYVTVPTTELMLVVQWAATKIRYCSVGTVGIIVSRGDESQHIFAYGQFAKLLEKYRAYLTRINN